MHVVQIAMALLASGAAVMVIAGLVLESLHDDDQHLRLMAERPDPVPRFPVSQTTAAPMPIEAEIADDAAPFQHTRGNAAGRNKRNQSRSDDGRETARQRRKEQRRDKKRERPERHTRTDGCTIGTETEGA